jgi:hypothetical protein
MSVTRLALLSLCLAMPAVAQPVTRAQFNGIAHIGSVIRNVVIRFSCAMDRKKINNLAVELDVPEAEGFKRVFDVNPFEGPSGIGGKHHLIATRTGSAQLDFASSGSFGNNGSPGTTFTFSAAMVPSSKAALTKLQAVAGVLSGGPSHVSWTIENPAHGDAAIEVSADVAEGEAGLLKAAVGPCL